MLVNFFNAFDRSGSGYVDAREFACDLSLFMTCSKSEKLSYLSQLFEREGSVADGVGGIGGGGGGGDGRCEGRLTRRGMWRYLRSILTALFAVCHRARSRAPALSPAD